MGALSTASGPETLRGEVYGGMVVGEVMRGSAASAVREVSSEVQADPFMSCCWRLGKGSSGSSGAVSLSMGLASKTDRLSVKVCKVGAGRTMEIGDWGLGTESGQAWLGKMFMRPP